MTQMQQLSGLSLITVSGADAATLLQQQLTQDFSKPPAGRALRAAWCDVKGRMLATFTAFEYQGAWQLMVDASLAAAMHKRLSMFVLRLKAQVSLPAEPIYGWDAHDDSATETAEVLAVNDGVVCIAPQAYVSINAVLNQTLAAQAQSPVQLDAENHWWLVHHTAQGVAHITAQTSGAFVPQMVNYELVGGVNFKKGCYPGQEVVARSQYLGKLKRRASLARVADSAAGAAPITAMQDVLAAGQPEPVGQVIQAVPAMDGSRQTLVMFESTVASLAQPLTVQGMPITLLALPYAITDITA